MRLEEIMAGLFGGNTAQGLNAPAADDVRRRRTGQGSGYGGIAGGAVSLAELIPHLQGLRSYDYSGPMAGGFRGLADMVSGPAAGHFQQQGGQGFGPPQAAEDQLPPGLAAQAAGGDLPPGLDNRNPIGGANIAPGNLGNAQAAYQSARPGLGAPHTQGWRNVAPGYSAAAHFGYGTPAFDQALQGVGAGPAGGRVAPGLRGAEGGGGTVAGTATGGGGGTAPSQGVGGGGGRPTPSGRPGGGGAPPGVTPAVKKEARRQPTSRGGIDTGPGGGQVGIQQGSTTGRPAGVNKQGNFNKKRFNREARDIRENDPTQAFGSTIHTIPNQGNNNTPSETGGAQSPGKFAGLTPKQKAAKKAAFQARVAARQEAQRVEAAPSASQFGANSATNDRGTGLEPIKGKTKPKVGKVTSGGYQTGGGF